MKTNLRLFVWTGFSPDYTSGLAFAISKNEEDARKAILRERGFKVSTWGDLTVYEIRDGVAKSVSGGG